MNLGGVVPPLITPLDAQRRFDEEGFARLIDACIAAGAGGVFVLGSSGEGPWFTPREQREVLRAAVRLSAGRVPVLGGILEASTPRVLEALDTAQEAGVDAVVVTTPYYFAADAETQLRHVEAVARAAAVPVLLYNIPQMTQAPLEPATVRRLLEHERVVGIKDSAGDPVRFRELIALKEMRPDFAVFQGAERRSLPALQAGADGLVPGLGNVVPELFVAMTAAVRAGDAAAAARCQDRIDALWELHRHAYFLTCLKHAASLKGFGSGATRAHPPLSDPGKEAIRNLLEPYLTAPPAP